MAKKQKLLSPEERREQDLQSELKDLQFVPFPTYFFKVGDPVSVGALTDPVIANVYADGRIYEVDFTDIEHNYGNPIIKTHQKRFFDWLRVRPIAGDNHELIHNKDLQLNYSQRQIGGILSNVYNFGTDLDPEYQRGYVWEMEDKVALIDSIFNNIDIGKFVFSYREYDGGYGYEIIDGKQRINALCEYYENKFDYNGLFFNDLSHHEQYQFDDYPVSYAEIRNATREQKLRYFVMLNKHGKVMDKEHLKKVENMLNEYV